MVAPPILHCDWLGLSLRLLSEVREAPVGFRWCRYEKTNVWASRWSLFTEEGDKVFTLLFHPRQSIIHTDAALVEIANEWFYHGLGESGALRLLSSVVGYTIVGISRLDLAVDFVPDRLRAAYIKMLADGRLYVGGKRNGSGFWSVVHDEKLPSMWQGRIPHCISWGHKTTDVRWKLYYKTRELREAMGGKGWSKPYIVDSWREADMDIWNVWRLEVSIHNCNNLDFMGDRLTYEVYRCNTVALFKALYTSRFVVRRNQGHKDRSNDTIVNFLPVGALRKAIKVAPREATTKRNGRLTLLRHLVSDVEKEEVMLSDTIRESVLCSIGDIVEHDGMEKYFKLVVGEEFDSWREWLRVRSYYFGEEHVKREESDYFVMEDALRDAGLISSCADIEDRKVKNPEVEQLSLRLLP